MARFGSSLGVSTCVLSLVLSAPVFAQAQPLPPLPQRPTVADSDRQAPITPLTDEEIRALPLEYQGRIYSADAPPVANPNLDGETITRSIGDDGIETITRTREIPARSNAAGAGVGAQPTSAYAATPSASTPAPAGSNVLEREQWLEECKRRTQNQGGGTDGGKVGGLLGAIGGGAAGYGLAGETLGGTLLDAGVGGIASLLLGRLIAGDGREEPFDCEAALDGHLDQHTQQQERIASRSIPGQDGAPASAPPAQPAGTVVPVVTYQQQHVIIRETETVREELIPGDSAIPLPGSAPNEP